jgi:uncharacterized zinc-type alcohol dehydrogenase-like protein
VDRACQFQEAITRFRGATVTMISRSADKAADARSLGADHVLLSTDAQALAAATNGFDVIIDTIPVQHDLKPYLPLLDLNATLVMVGQIGTMDGCDSASLVFGRRHITGTPVGGIEQTQEMLDSCADKGLSPECELIEIRDINDAFDRMERSDVRYRFVIDMALLGEAQAA